MRHRHSTPLRTTLLLLLAVLAGGCATFSYQEEEIVLEDTTWRIVGLDGEDVRRRSDNRDLSPHLYIMSTDGRVHGAGGCNRFSGPYRATGTEIQLGPITSTRSICADADRQAMEDRIFAALPEIDSYRLEDDRLWLYSGGQARIEARVW